MIVFSGMRPSGQLHIGNYLGALKNWVELQKKHQCVFGVVDYHAITTPFNPKAIKKDSMALVLDYLAAGIDPKKSIIIVQSHIPEHTELAWILSTLAPLGELERMTQFKDKAKQNKENVNAGLFCYPVLMAADILLYKADLVPVGEDQAQHVELTRTLARKFNNKFGKTFPEPKAQLLKFGARIMSLTDPNQKMSKTGDESIALIDSPEKIREKIKKAVTDSGKEVKYDEKNKPAISNLLTIYHLFSDKAIADIEKKYQGKGYAEFKKDLTEVIIRGLKPFQERRKKLEKNPRLTEKILAEGQKKAQKIAQETIKEVKTKMGLI
ncbi:MAG: tryptophan--tRNA ligase [Candidatus Portnoybacteria bacterium RBG_13_40_8]|uniref:Tryptophan--tRNA ligase n=1 Tax=Candidatus Portnoybacteria bacterium RBG_13_40_8 TaxID=1801990 RepID=A0A1G2F314_9BACT|nr:MAG: tryptophan--tRNA ligase [Candidatus Portnoybacteria bacterium RBG_13_40_8]OGZ35785.1 MAG: tryptophan--tRNA ligase [Candidatus Portnoybacteria bacterium RIFCSPHIGHO2_01_FULL_39_19]